ncbi:MAG: GNAT family N-acetyltransferase [Streptosporangiales bacterium]
MRIRDLTNDDLPRVLELNNAATPAVSPLDRAGLDKLAEMAVVQLGAEADGAVVGFALGFGPGAPYGSENYRYFAERLADFCYIDRIVVDPTYYRRGIGSALYDEVERRCTAAVLTCEVNIKPRNEESLAFHAKRGFAEVDTQETGGGTTTVALMQKPLR